jgi:hypothetical protein
MAAVAEGVTAPRPIRTSAFRPHPQTSTATMSTARTSQSVHLTRMDSTATVMGSAVNPKRLHAASALSNDHRLGRHDGKVSHGQDDYGLVACLLPDPELDKACERGFMGGDAERPKRRWTLDLKTVVGKDLAGFRTHKRFRGRYLKGKRRYVSFALDTKGDPKWDYGIYFDRFDITTCLSGRRPVPRGFRSC